MPLHVRDLGDGPPVVFLHPGPGLDGSVFLPHVQPAGRRGLPRAARRPARRRPRRRDWTLPGQAAAVEELMRELDAERTLLGHSFGGYVAMQHLVDYPGQRRAGRRLLHRRRRGGAAGRARGPLRGPARGRRGRRPRRLRARELGDRRRRSAAQVWRDQMPFFADDPAKVVPMLDDVVFQLEAHHGHDFGELHALEALAAADSPGARDRGRARTGPTPARSARGSPRPPRAASWWSSRASATSRSPRRPTATGRR